MLKYLFSLFVHILHIYIYSIWYKPINFSLLLNPAIQRMGNTPNILHLRHMEQVESHPHFIFYCKLSKVTLDCISELIKINYFFNLPFRFSLKTIKTGSFSIIWWCTYKNSTHTLRSETHASLQSLSWRWIWQNQWTLILNVVLSLFSTNSELLLMIKAQKKKIEDLDLHLKQ